MQTISGTKNSDAPYAAVGGRSEINAPFGPQGIGTQRMVDLALRSGTGKAELVTKMLRILNSVSGSGKTFDKVPLEGFLVSFLVGSEGESLVTSFVGESSALGNSESNAINWITILTQQVRNRKLRQTFESNLEELLRTAENIQAYNELLVEVMEALKEQSANANPYTGLEKFLQ